MFTKLREAREGVCDGKGETTTARQSCRNIHLRKLKGATGPK
jgi:hypothetical protein